MRDLDVLPIYDGIKEGGSDFPKVGRVLLGVDVLLAERIELEIVN